MRKAVLISIKPRWCELIASEKKTIEVRKTRPKMLAPFKCYIYCTQTTHWNPALIRRYENPNGNIYIGGNHYSEFMTARVIGEFVCDKVIPFSFYCSDPTALITHFEVPGTCLSDVEIMNYLGNGKDGWGWHISELKMYETPKLLSDFKRYAGFAESDIIKRAPQSWCYVEELEG